VRVDLYDDLSHARRSGCFTIRWGSCVDPDVRLDLQRRHNVTLPKRWRLLENPRLRALAAALRPRVPPPLTRRITAGLPKPPSLRPTAEERARAISISEQEIRDLAELLDRHLSA
jgi:hypothetical protein